MDGAWRLRAAILTIVGAVVVHQGRFLLAPPDHSHAGVHGYLTWAIPVVGFLLVVAVAELLVRLERSDSKDPPLLPPTAVLSVVFTLVLISIFVTQESIEMILGHGAVVLDGNPLISDGAWVAIPLAIVAGAVVALLLRGAAMVVALAARRRRALPRPARTRAPRRADVAAAHFSGISRSLAPRGPPLLLS